MLRISRRDFLNGVALATASGLPPAQQLAAAPARYPPALTGLRGQHDGSFEFAHAFARGGANLHTDDAPIDESYDLAVWQRACCAISASTSAGSKPLSIAGSILRLDFHAPFFSAAMRWSVLGHKTGTTRHRWQKALEGQDRP
jgi:spermidine dehydrogenase